MQAVVNVLKMLPPQWIHFYKKRLIRNRVEVLSEIRNRDYNIGPNFG